MSDRLLTDGVGYTSWSPIDVQRECTPWEDVYCDLVSNPIGFVATALAKETCHDMFYEEKVWCGVDMPTKCTTATHVV